MPLTTLDPFGGIRLSDFPVSINPLPKDADVRIWVDGVEKPLHKTIGIHLENATEETEIFFYLNGTLVEPEEGYVDYLKYYYIRAELGDGVFYRIIHPGRPTWEETLTVNSNIMRTVDLARNTLHLCIIPTPLETHTQIVNEQNVIVAEADGIINVDLPFYQLYTYFLTATGYKPIAQSILLSDDTTLRLELSPICSTGTLTLTATNAVGAESEFYSQETSALYGWTSSTDSSLTYYTKTSVPQIGDMLYDETGHSVNKVITAYDPTTGIEYSNL